MLCFTGIVKNEIDVIARCLRSVKPMISCWAIADTGSTDGTQEAIRRELDGIPGVLRSDKWQDFATNRNLALAAARDVAARHGADYVMTIDADEELCIPPGVDLSRLTHDAYNAIFELAEQDNRWQRMLLMRADKPWQFAGVLHEQPKLSGGSVGLLGDLSVISHSDGARNKQGSRKKYLADAAVLKRELKRDPKDSRSWFYYARSLAAGGKLDAAIDAYRQRLRLGEGQNAEEIFHALYQIAAIKEMRGDHWQDVARAYLEAFNDRPWRAEPLWALAVIHNQAGEHAAAELYARRAAGLQIPPDGLFVQQSVYEWRAADELAAALAKLGRFDEARDVLERLKQRPQLPAVELQRVNENIELLKAAA